MNLVLVHGYNVTSTRTYGVLPQRLKAAGHRIRHVYLSKYVTLDNDITLDDLVLAFDAALKDALGRDFGRAKFACLTHSTGGLVVRAWIRDRYADNRAALPLSHLIMLAPPNNGSRLAELGKSRLSRLRSLVGVEPGVKILDALELGSRRQWDLNADWIRLKLHAIDDFYPFVITGQWIDKKVWDAIVPATYERGSDGVVRASSANLNMQKITLNPDGSVLREVMAGVPFLIPPKISHSGEDFGVMAGIPARGSHPVLEAILAALKVDSRRAYQELEADFAMKTTLLQRKDTYYDKSPLGRYSQLVFRVTDNQGNALPDYAVELIDSSGRGDHLPGGFFGDKHKNAVSPEMFVYYLNYDRMTEVKGGKLGFRIQSVPDTPLIMYPEQVFMGPSEVESVLRPNQTTFVDVILRRRINKNTFRLTTSHAYQKIDGKPGEEWID